MTLPMYVTFVQGAKGEILPTGCHEYKVIYVKYFRAKL